MAFLYVERASVTKEATADQVWAKRIWKHVLEICEPLRPASVMATNPRYWLLAAMSEASLGLGQATQSQQLLDEANKLSPAQWMKDSTTEQRAKLQTLL